MLRIVLYLLLLLQLCVPVFAVDYFVDGTNGSDANLGTSHSEAFKTLTHAWTTLNGIGIADNSLYLLCGSTFQDQYIYVNWTASAGNSVIGAYYWDGSTEVRNTAGGAYAKPVIQGVLDLEYPENNYPSVGSFLAGVLIKTPYATVQDLHIKDQGQTGIRALSTADNVVIQRCVIENTYWGNMYLNGGCSNALIQYNVCDKSAMKMAMDPYLRPWAGSIVFRHCANTVCRYNYVRRSWGEGIGMGVNSQVYGNIIMDFNSVGIYCDGCEDSIAQNNLVVGSTDLSVNWQGNGWCGRAYEVNVEPVDDNSHNVANVVFLNNTAINCLAGFKAVQSNTLYTWDYVWVLNNQFIDCEDSFDFNGNVQPLPDHVYIKNNISYPKHADADHLYAGGDTSDQWEVDGNWWVPVKTVPTGQYRGPNDEIALDPGYGRTGDFRGVITDLTDLTTADFTPTLFVQGVDLGASYDDGLLAGATDFIKPNQDTDPVVLTLADRDLSGWFIGPFVESGIPTLGGFLPVSEQPCGGVTIQFTSDGPVSCQVSSTPFSYGSGTQLTVGEGSTEHSVQVTPACSEQTLYYFMCQDGEGVNTLLYQHAVNVAGSASAPESLPPVDIIPGNGGGIDIVPGLGSGTAIVAVE